MIPLVQTTKRIHHFGRKVWTDSLLQRSAHSPIRLFIQPSDDMKITAVPEMGREGPVTRAMSLTPAPSSTPTAFHPFKKMPVELRNKVWKLAIPEHGPRVLNLIIQQ